MWFRSVFDFLKLDSRARGRRPRSAASRLLLELLEDRTVPSFLAPVDYAAGPHPQGVATGSFRNNGIQDLVVTNPTADSVGVLLGNGNGTFQPPLTLTTGPDPTSVAVGDFGNGHLDIVTANAASLTMLLGNGDGTFQPGINFTLPGEFPPQYSGSTPVGQTPVSLAVGDMNHDGKLDLVVTGRASYSYYSGSYTYNGRKDYVNVLLGNGNGTFTPASATPLNFLSSPTMALGDFNGDGNLDVAVGEWDTGIAVLLGNGAGTLGAPSLELGDGPLSLAAGDLNGDGKLDLVGTTGGGAVQILMGNGDGTFQTPVNISLPGISPAGYKGVDPLPLRQVSEAVVVGDLTGDGKLDLAVTTTSSYSVYAGTAIDPYYGTPYKVYDTAYKSNVNVLVGNGNGTFTDGQIIPLADTALPPISGPYPFSLTEGNFNNDTFPDLAVPDYGTGNVSVLINGANWPTFAVSGFPSPTTAGASGSFTVTVKNPDGTVDTGYAGTVHFTSPDNQAVLPADYTFTAADAGTHTFSATLKSAGPSSSITATDTTTGSITGSDSGITVLPAAASKLILVYPPTSTTAGQVIYPAVKVVVADQYSNVVTTDSSTVTLTLSSGTFADGSATASAVASSGVATFSSLKIDTAGSYTLEATDGSLTAVTSASFTVSPAGPSKFILTAPASVRAGASFSLTLTVEDAYGNIVTDYTGTVHFSSTDRKAKLPSNYTFTNSDRGVHTFTGLVLRTRGKEKITIADTRNGPLGGTWPTVSVIMNVL